MFRLTVTNALSPTMIDRGLIAVDTYGPTSVGVGEKMGVGVLVAGVPVAVIAVEVAPVGVAVAGVPVDVIDVGVAPVGVAVAGVPVGVGVA